MTIRRHLFVLVLSILIPALATTALTGYFAYRVERSRAERNLLNMANAVAGGVDGELSRARSVLDALAASPSLEQGDLAAFWKQAKDGVDDDVWVALFSANGQQLVNTLVPFGTTLPDGPPPENVRRVLETGQPVISDLFTGRVAGRQVISVDVPVRRDGRIIYTLGMVIPPATLGRVLSGAGIPRHWAAAVLDRSRHVVARSEDGDRYLGSPSTPDLDRVMSRADSGLAYVPTLSGALVLAAYSRSPTYGWYFAVGVPRSELMAPVKQMTAFVLAAALALLGGGGVLSVAVGRRITRPLEALAKPAMALGRGEVPQIEPSGVAEADQVAQALVAAGKIRANMAARFREVVMSAPVPIMLHAEDGRVLALSRTWCEATGYGLGDIPTVSRWAELAYGSGGKEPLVKIAQLYGAGGAVDLGEHRVRTADGGERVWAFRAAPVGRDRKGVRLAVSIAADLTERIRAEEAMVAAKIEAEMANVAKSKFLAAASHDLRQPLQALMLLNEVLKVQLQGEAPTKLVETMGASLTAMQNLLDGLLDISRLDAGVIVPAPEPVAIGQLVQRLGDEYAIRAAEKGLRLRVVRCDRWGTTDPGLIERVLRNLLENAIRYTKQGSILFGCRTRGDTLQVHVVDTGVGIAADQHEAIFHEFYQVGNPERDRNQGLGLGLSIVRRLVQLLGHGLALSSAPGKGSRFVISLPRAAAPRPVVGQKRPPEGDPPRQGVIMVIDDEAAVRHGLGAMLEQWGYRVLLAGDADEAVGLVSACRRCPDAVIADYRLREGLNGIGAIQQVHAACGRFIPAVIITGDTDPQRINEAMRSGLRIVHKPVSAPRLREIVEVAMAAE
jgi:two-component system, sensor histidine kinase